MTAATSDPAMTERLALAERRLRRAEAAQAEAERLLERIARDLDRSNAELRQRESDLITKLDIGNRNLIRANGQTEALPSKIPYRQLRKGDRITAYGPCGGGYGNPMLRAPQDVLEDVLDGLIDDQAAQAQYGVVIRNGREVDTAATQKLRAAG